MTCNEDENEFVSEYNIAHMSACDFYANVGIVVLCNDNERFRKQKVNTQTKYFPCVVVDPQTQTTAYRKWLSEYVTR